jgi:acyl carrier protein
MNTIEERITRILHDDFQVPPGAIGADSTFADLEVDSLVIVELALALGREFGTPLADGELTDSMTVPEAAALLMSKRAQAA